MFERFTDKARRAVVLAQEEARLLRHDYIGTEHILLGLIQEGGGIAAHALESMGVTHEAARQQVEIVVGVGTSQMSGHIPFTPQAKKTLQLSMREAIQLGDNYIGTEHILLGIIRGGEGPAIEALQALGHDPTEIRRQVTGLSQRAHGEHKPSTPLTAMRAKVSARRRLETDVLAHLDSIESRLAALEYRVGAGPDVRDLDAEIMQHRQDKEAAIDAQDFETAARLRDRESELLADRAARREQWAADHRDAPSLTDEIDRIRDLLRQHGISPEDGVA